MIIGQKELNDLRQKIREWTKIKGNTQAELSRISGVSQATISMFLSGLRPRKYHSIFIALYNAVTKKKFSSPPDKAFYYLPISGQIRGGKMNESIKLVIREYCCFKNKSQGKFLIDQRALKPRQDYNELCLLRIADKSFEPEYQQNDLLVIENTKDSELIRSGDHVFYKLSTDEWIFSVWRQGNPPILEPFDDNLPPFNCPKRAKLAAIVIGLIRLKT